jgi:hypothetical protein
MVFPWVQDHVQSKYFTQQKWYIDEIIGMIHSDMTESMMTQGVNPKGVRYSTHLFHLVKWRVGRELEKKYRKGNKSNAMEEKNTARIPDSKLYRMHAFTQEELDRQIDYETLDYLRQGYEIDMREFWFTVDQEDVEVVRLFLQDGIMAAVKETGKAWETVRQILTKYARLYRE